MKTGLKCSFRKIYCPTLSCHESLSKDASFQKYVQTLGPPNKNNMFVILTFQIEITLVDFFCNDSYLFPHKES